MRPAEGRATVTQYARASNGLRRVSLSSNDFENIGRMIKRRSGTLQLEGDGDEVFKASVYLNTLIACAIVRPRNRSSLIIPSLFGSVSPNDNC